jgi:hypothetical protein
VGRAEYVEISACYATGAVTSRGDCAGGLVGGLWNLAVCKVSNCYATGDVRGGARIGGLIGDIRGKAGTIIENCYATGAVTGTVDRVGGVVGTQSEFTAALPNMEAILKNCIALNISVKTSGSNAGRVLGAISNIVQLSDNAAWDGILNNMGDTNWGAGAHDNLQGVSKTLNDLQQISGFPDAFAAAPWTYAAGKLPGLNGESVEMPIHLMSAIFTINASGTHIFERKSPGYTNIDPLTVTVTNLASSSIGPVTIAVTGEDFELDKTSITSIAAGNDATFDVSPITGLGIGSYMATVTVTTSVFTESFGVSFTVAEGGGNTGFPDAGWYDASEAVFHISAPDELAGLAQLVNSGTTFSGKTVILDNDIDLEKYATGTGWTPIGKDGTISFRGVFDGDNNAITGLVINATAASQGLFGFVNSATIKNLEITDASVTGGGNTGILVGQALSSIIENCSSSGTVTAAAAVRHLGGLIGSISGNNSTVNNCNSSANVTNSPNGGHESSTGGLIGTAGGTSTNPVIVTKCYATGDVSGVHYTGGLIGQAGSDGALGITVSSSFATGVITSNGDGIGGLVGFIWQGTVALISNTYATGNVTGRGWTGGLVGNTRAADNSKIENSYATGLVIGKSDGTGGLVGGSDGAGGAGITQVTNCIALNPKVESTSTMRGRLIGRDVVHVARSNNAAWDGILNNDDNTTWTPAGAADNISGASKTVYEIHSAGFFQSVFTAGDQTMWTFAADKLPGLEGVALDMPEHLAISVQTPVITTQPEGAFVPLGSSLELRVVVEPVTDGGTLSYKWYSNDKNSYDDATEISGATNSTYTYNAQEEGTFYFFVAVTNTVDINATATVRSDIVEVQVTAQELYRVTVNSEGGNPSGSGDYPAGATVNINAGTPPTYHRFVNWTATPTVTFANANNASTSFTMIGQPVTVTANFELVTYVATVTVNKDGVVWSNHGKTFTLKFGTDENETVAIVGTTANVHNGDWKVYDGETYTGATLTINAAAGSATLNYFTIEFSVIEGGSASGSAISAIYDGVSITSGTAVIGGKMLIVTVAANGADNYTYSWGGTTSGSAAINSTNPVNARVNAICTVTGGGTTSAENPLNVNPLNAYVNSGILHVSGLTEGKVWKLYNISGALVKQGIAGRDTVTITLDASGVYIIQSEGNTLKIIFN